MAFRASAAPPESVDKPLPPDPIPLVCFLTNAPARPHPDRLARVDHVETTELQETKDPLGIQAHQETRVLADHPDLLDQMEIPEQRDLLDNLESFAPLPLLLLVVPEHPDAPDHVVDLDSPADPATMVDQDPPDPKATVALRALPVDQASLVLLVNPGFPEPLEAATIAHQPVWLLDIKPCATAQWPAKKSKTIDLFLVYVATHIQTILEQ